MLSGRTSTCAPARADPGYLEDQIAFGVTLLFGNVGAETSPPFRALFLKILQDLENKRETRDSRKRARRARSAEGSAGIGRREVCGAGLGRVQAHTGCTNTETSGRGLVPYGCARARGACGTCEARSREPPSASPGSSRGCGAGLICTQHRHCDVATTLPVLHFSLTLRFVTLLVLVWTEPLPSL